MTLLRKFVVSALMAYTLVITAFRAVRLPNNFAEAHWLLDYRFGFVKRGLVGEIIYLTTQALSIPITEQLISTLSVITFVFYCFAILLVSIRISSKFDWSTGTIFVLLVFLSSPFVVMSAHLIGYYDNIVIVLGILSVVLLIRNRPWLGACLQVLSFLVHENTLFLVFAPFCLAWTLMNSKRQKGGLPKLSFLVLVLPVLVFLVITASQEIFLKESVRKLN